LTFSKTPRSTVERLLSFTGCTAGYRHSLQPPLRNARLSSNTFLKETFAGSTDDRLTGIVRNLVIELLTYEGLFIAPAALPVAGLSTAQTWEAQKLLRRQLSALEDPHAQEAIANTLMDCVLPIVPDHVPPEGQEHEHSLSCPLISFLPDHAYAIEMAIAAILTKSGQNNPFPRLYQQLDWNAQTASGINPERPGSKQPIPPTKAKRQLPDCPID
jgi:hypothetical protein